jgi:hypothetical protein
MIFMSRYFKMEAESEHGEGELYVEFSADGFPSRQVEIYRSVWRLGDRVRNLYLGDQSIEWLDDDAVAQIDEAQFAAIWQRAETRVPPALSASATHSANRQ